MRKKEENLNTASGLRIAMILLGIAVTQEAVTIVLGCNIQLKLGTWGWRPGWGPTQHHHGSSMGLALHAHHSQLRNLKLAKVQAGRREAWGWSTQ